MDAIAESDGGALLGLSTRGRELCALRRRLYELLLPGQELPRARQPVHEPAGTELLRGLDLDDYGPRTADMTPVKTYGAAPLRLHRPAEGGPAAGLRLSPRAHVSGERALSAAEPVEHRRTA